jgi:hypothetical protein
MSTDGRLGPAKLRKIAIVTGLTPVCGWAWHPVWEFVVIENDGHAHFDFLPRDRTWNRIAEPQHYTSCRQLGRTAA